MKIENGVIGLERPVMQETAISFSPQAYGTLLTDIETT